MTDNSIITNSKAWDQICRMASLEQAGDNILLIRKFARSASLTANVAADVWTGDTTLSLLSSAETLTVVSSSLDDDVAGIGAQYVEIGGVDANYDLISEIVTMDGTTPVITTNTFLRVNRARVVTSGTSKFNVGNINITATTATTRQAYIVATESITQQSHFTVPDGYTAFTTSVVLSVYRASGGTGAKSAEVDQLVFIPSINTQYKTIKYGIRGDGGPLVTTPPAPSQSPARSTLWYQATAEATGTIVTSSQEIVLIKGDYNLRTEI